MRSIPLLLTAAVLLACGGGGGGSGGAPTAPDPPGPGPQQPSATAQVQMRSQGDIYGDVTHSFQPTLVTITTGGQVTWNNNSGFVHNVTFSGANAPANIPDFGSGSQTRNFPTNGDFSFQCTLHPEMQGQVRVQ